ncbi:Glycosyltransferase involved in cell wall bisynthesis [Ralstonia sp. 25mfcol4.1]|uniref:glycosyltransferase n=1 Tax=Ralstonia sp. 25mfcol4.1 TaxID=1761899 RepID=UPI0004916205|nr:glycosyltransferase [Ralstonia sp. 25mfcol4.1]SDP57214.1 Glycosyltransferase involved in cell wall bisynthesis [Ralstonia sp. 25mfcol4.1]
MKRIKLLALGPQEVIPPVNGGKEGIQGALASLARHFDVTYAYPRAENSAAVADGYQAMGVRQLAVPFAPVESISVVANATMRGQPYKFAKYSTADAARVHLEAIGSDTFDAILCFHPHTVALAEKISRARGWHVPIVLREHNIEYELVYSYRDSLGGVKRLAAGLFAHLTRREEIDIWKRVDAVAFLTDHDLAIARAQDKRSNFRLAPEGIPIPPKRTVSRQVVSTQLLALLNPSATQSVASLKRFLHTVWAPASAEPALQEVSVAVTGVDENRLAALVGMTPEQLGALRIRALGFVPSLAAAFAESLALVSPTYVGGGIRKKILEAMANQVPVVATRLDAESCGYFRPGENLLAFDTAQEFVAGVSRLVTDDAFWRDIAEAGRRTVEQHASWQLFADEIHAEIGRLLSGAGTVSVSEPA